MLGFDADNQERIFETSLVQKGDFIKAWDRTLGQKSYTGVMKSGPLHSSKLGVH